MRRKKFSYPYPLPENLIAAIESIADPTQRAIAACEARMIADSDRTRAILASCVAEADAFYAASAAMRLAIRAVPLRKARAPARHKKWTAPNRVPALFDVDPRPAELQTDWSIGAVEPVSASELVSNLAAATLEMSAEGDGQFVDLVATPGFAELVERMKGAPPLRDVGNEDFNLFRSFGVEVAHTPESTPQSDIPWPHPRKRRRRRSHRPIGTDLVAMGAGHE